MGGLQGEAGGSGDHGGFEDSVALASAQPLWPWKYRTSKKCIWGSPQGLRSAWGERALVGAREEQAREGAHEERALERTWEEQELERTFEKQAL